jgi:hypothetical protein
MTVGDRVKLRHDVDRYPHFIARAGSLGTVVDDGSSGVVFSVRLDVKLAGAEEWDNEIHWDLDDENDDPERDLEVQ